MLSAATINVTKFSIIQDSTCRLVMANFDPLELLRMRQFISIDDVPEESSVGWVAWEDLTDTEWTNTTPHIGGHYLAFAFRIDTRRVAPAIVKKELALAFKIEEAKLAAQGKKFMSREHKREIKEQVKLRLMARTIPTPKSIGVVWDTDTNTVFFLSTNEKEIDLFSEYFTSTFNLELQEERIDLEKTYPSSFLSWCWFNSDLADGFCGHGLTIEAGSKIKLSGEDATVNTSGCVEEAKLALQLGKTVKSISATFVNEQDDIQCACILNGHLSRLDSVSGIVASAPSELDDDYEAVFLSRVYIIEKLFRYLEQAYTNHLASKEESHLNFAYWLRGEHYHSETRQ